MTDITLAWHDDAAAADLLLAGGQLATDVGMRTAILISLFTDARAADDDALPQPGGDPRGWWGDALAADRGDGIGSRLWLLSREKITAATVNRARDYAEAALAWLVEDRVAKSVVVEVEAIRPQTLALSVAIERPTGPARDRYDFVWEASE